MAAYYVLTHTISDLERYRNEYIPAASPIMAKHQGEIVAVSFHAEVLQGDPPSGITIARFPSEEAVHAMINDPAYQPVKEIRMRVTTDVSAVIVPEFQRPGN